MVNPNNPQKNDTLTVHSHTLVVVDEDQGALILVSVSQNKDGKRLFGPRQRYSKAWWALWAENPAATFGHLDVQVETAFG